jgi:hypothetical protein
MLLLPLSLAMDNGKFDRSGGGGGGGGPVAAAAAAVVAVDYRDWWRWHLMAAAALGRGHATTSWCSKRVAQQKNKRAAQGEAMQQPANLLLRCHFDMRRCHLRCRHSVTRHPCLPCHYSNTRHCLQPRGNGNGKE